MADDGVVVALVIDRAAADDVAGVVAALGGIPEAQRAAVWKNLREHPVRTDAGVVAALGVAPTAHAVAEVVSARPLRADAEPFVVDMLADRPPDWLRSMARKLGSGALFRVVRALVRRGLIDETDAGSEPLAMAHHLVGLRPGRPAAGDVLQALRADPRLLVADVWRMLRTAGSGRVLAFHDYYCLNPQKRGWPQPGAPEPQATWLHAFVTLADDGAIDRGRLLDAALHAMLADWAASDVGWFTKLQDALAPTDNELTARKPTYLRLLASENGTVVQVGLRAAGRLLEAGVVGRAELAPALRPVLLRTQKGTATATLNLLARLGKADDADRGLLADVARLGQDHPRADVREQARNLVQRWLPPGEREGPDGSEPPAEVPPPAPAEPEPVIPPADADEVAELLAHLIEEADDPIAVERALDGVLHFADTLPSGADALAARAYQRVTQFPGPWSGQEARVDLAALTLFWLARSHGGGYLEATVGIDYTSHWSTRSMATTLRREDWSLATLVTARIHEAMSRLGGAPSRLLSLPVTSDGSITARTLSERMADLRHAPPLDLGIALLRVPRSELGQVSVPHALPRRNEILDDIALLAAYEPRWQRVVGVAADRPARSLPMPAWSDAPGPEGSLARPVRAVLDRRRPLDRAGLETADGEDVARFAEITGVWPLMLPHRLDLLAAHAHPRFVRALSTTRSGGVPILEAIGRASALGGAPTWSAFALSFAAKDPAVRTAAIDAFILRAGRDLVDAAGLGEQIQLCLSDDLVVGTRIVECLAEAARADRTSATRALDVLAATIDAIPGRRDAHRWVELLADLTNDLDCSVPLPQPFHDLARSADRSVLAKACRRVRAAG